MTIHETYQKLLKMSRGFNENYTQRLILRIKGKDKVLELSGNFISIGKFGFPTFSLTHINLTT
jgi:hypothetical protein